MKESEIAKILSELNSEPSIYEEDVPKKSRKSKKQQVLSIKNSYISNNKTKKLYEELDNAAIAELIKLKTETAMKTAQNAKDTLTKKVEAILLRQIPNSLKIAYKRFGYCFIKHPGFMYVTTHEYGERTLWLEPDIPYFFKQFSEMSVINKHALFARRSLDKHVELYHRYMEKVIRIEAKIAVQLDGIKTIIQLLEYDVDYYLLYKDIMEAFKIKEQRSKLDEGK